MTSDKIQKRLDTALPDIASQIEVLGRIPDPAPLGEAPLRAMASALNLSRAVLSREPGDLIPVLYYRDSTTPADAVTLLRLVHARLLAFARRHGYRARW